MKDLFRKIDLNDTNSQMVEGSFSVGLMHCERGIHVFYIGLHVYNL